MEYSHTIPDDPKDILLDPVFQGARTTLLCLLQSIDDSNLADETEYVLYREAGSEHIFPQLADDIDGELRGKLDICFRVPFHDETLEIAKPPFDDSVTIIHQPIGWKRSISLIASLPLRERILVTQYAFAERYDALSRKIQRRKQTDRPMGKLPERIIRLYTNYERTMRLLSDDE